ncbi:MAG: hypothetical protein A2Y10_03750 [Planctomycetes bacterium GWF2_41_51]|nr:MAG: hypothetical protein A2Y10_03750 [Planctomycetes bacterium GWF2_41_51]
MDIELLVMYFRLNLNYKFFSLDVAGIYYVDKTEIFGKGGGGFFRSRSIDAYSLWKACNICQ